MTNTDASVVVATDRKFAEKQEIHTVAAQWNELMGEGEVQEADSWVLSCRY